MPSYPEIRAVKRILSSSIVVSALFAASYFLGGNPVSAVTAAVIIVPMVLCGWYATTPSLLHGDSPNTRRLLAFGPYAMAALTAASIPGDRLSAILAIAGCCLVFGDTDRKKVKDDTVHAATTIGMAIGIVTAMASQYLEARPAFCLMPALVDGIIKTTGTRTPGKAGQMRAACVAAGIIGLVFVIAA